MERSKKAATKTTKKSNKEQKQKKKKGNEEQQKAKAAKKNPNAAKKSKQDSEKHMQFTCNTDIIHIHFACNSHQSHVMRMRFTFISHVIPIIHMRCACAEAKKPTDEKVCDIDPEFLNARIVMHDPDKYLSTFIEYWSQPDNMPCVDGSNMTVESMRQWQKDGHSKQVRKLAAHRFLPGLCRTYSNNSLDFCLSMGLLPVIFDSPDDPDETVDMVRPFTIAFWVCYCNHKEDEEGLEADNCQKVANSQVSHVNQHTIHMRTTCESHAIHMHLTHV